MLLPSPTPTARSRSPKPSGRRSARYASPAIDRQVTASGGVATLPRDAGDSVTLFRAADRALYAAKNAGRDRVHTAAEQPLSHALVTTANGHDAE